jgi:putative nucleotidyltransferase with HDIG domain
VNSEGKRFFLAHASVLASPEVFKDIIAPVANGLCPEFFEVATSRTGKYHPDWANGSGGLVRHSVVVAHLCAKVYNAFYPDEKQEDLDAVVLAGLFHDCGKGQEESNGPWTENSTKSHGIISARRFALVSGFLPPDVKLKHSELLDRATEAIRWHMLHWTKRGVMPMSQLIREQSTDCIIVATCDNIASYSDIGFEFLIP